MKKTSGVLLNEFGVQSLLKLPRSAQKQALNKARGVITEEPEQAVYPLKWELAGFRGIHFGRYWIVWRVLTLEGGEKVADISYVGIRAEGDMERDAYAIFQKLLDQWQ